MTWFMKALALSLAWVALPLLGGEPGSMPERGIVRDTSGKVLLDQNATHRVAQIDLRDISQGFMGPLAVTCPVAAKDMTEVLLPKGFGDILEVTLEPAKACSLMVHPKDHGRIWLWEFRSVGILRLKVSGRSEPVVIRITGR